jgi:hypothetical protein
LTRAQKANPPPEQRNHSRDDALAKLEGGDQHKAIVGHGYPSMIVTGSGQLTNDTNKYIATSNYEDWHACVAALQPCKSLALYACWVGATEDGVRFINELRSAIGGKTEVWAPNGMLHVDEQARFWLDADASWLVSRKDAPAKYDTSAHSALWWHPVKLEQAKSGPPEGSREAVPIQHLDLSGTIIVPQSSPYQLVLNGWQATRYFRGLIRSAALRIPSGPLAVMTGVIDVWFDDGVHMRYEILNDVLMRTPYDRNLYYRIVAPFGAGLRGI